MSDFTLQDPVSVANFIIDYAKKRKKPVSNLQLQKIMYFIQGAFLNKYDSPLINGTFSRWQYGPVIKEVYAIFRENGPSPIENISMTVNFENNGFEIEKGPKTTSESLGNSSVYSYLKEITLELLDVSPWELVKISHEQEIWSSYKDEIVKHSAPDYENKEIKKACKDNVSLWHKQ
ncbi:DUF4065 domain-containing protein [Lactococcus taiwanensis]|uniref:DUF4065 domain-containing protein n=1 Tax=Lactococcus taiwanensis TaxID=1151742 RepID=A0AA45KFG5_9LACT|nr:type II toxin-antitoxin system antitoxin SocA domain-containing protein [Lactococcus taiwanensis]QSE76299.1 DUF4065 domain-containing protein [Lactococcus taiwanensis]